MLFMGIKTTLPYISTWYQVIYVWFTFLIWIIPSHLCMVRHYMSYHIFILNLFMCNHIHHYMSYHIFILYLFICYHIFILNIFILVSNSERYTWSIIFIFSCQIVNLKFKYAYFVVKNIIMSNLRNLNLNTHIL